MILGGWGRFPIVDTQVETPRSLGELKNILARGPVIARGNGRAYGDSAVSRQGTMQMHKLNRMLAFDERNGQLVAEAGVLLADVIAAFLPRGWFPMVTPGTKLVTLGGMIAADVHGKNHHKNGSMATSVDWIEIVDGAGQLRRTSRDQNTELFEWTLGGMGLTGVIVRAAIRLRPVETGWITQVTKAAPNLDAAMAIFEAADTVTYSVAWIDCLAHGGALGRSLVMLGEHASEVDLDAASRRDRFGTASRRNLAVPVVFPANALNRLTMSAFNQLYYWNGARKTDAQLVHWDSYFYPLDAILHWNRIYGRHGFMQFQCVLPLEASKDGLTELLREISAAGTGSFLAVLKRFGVQESRFSFPMLGYTLALDFPVTRTNLELMERLDAITVANGGRFYLAKDARMRAETLTASDPRTEDFRIMRSETDSKTHFRSVQSERLVL
ncbi:MAG: FAD-binding oxidoreductase [Pseudomonadota bacterium]